MQLTKRPRRLRKNEIVRKMVRETKLNLEDLVYPLFVVEGAKIRKEISSMPGNYHFSIDMLLQEVKLLIKLGIDKIMLFGIPDEKDPEGSLGYAEEGIIQRGVRSLKETFGDKIYIITDVCMCEYTSHGHCGILDSKGYVQNDITLKYLGETALSHAKAGVDMVAPSDMMDGRVGYIREVLDANGFSDVPIMAYSAKYSSAYYGPFREAAGSAPSFGDRKSYQMDPANSREAILEAALDMEEGADIVMVKPALSYLDIICKIKEFSDVPVAAYNVSGEYSMLKMAVESGLMNEDVILETLLSIKRAGADIIITYFAKELAEKILAVR